MPADAAPAMTADVSPTTSLPRRLWLALVFLALSGQLAWGVENQYFNTFVLELLSWIAILIVYGGAGPAIASLGHLEVC